MITAPGARLLVCLVAVGSLAGCATVVDGSLQSGSGAPTTSGAPMSSGAPGPTVSPTPTPTASSSSATPAPSRPYARVPSATAVGDAATRDFCKVVSLSAIRVPKWKASLSANQFPPGCNVDLKRGTSTVSISAAVYSKVTRSGSHRTTTLSGLLTYVYPYDKATGYCPRTVMARGLGISVTSFPGSGNVRSSAVSCGGTDAVAKQLAAAVAANKVPPLPLASPSVTTLDICKVLRASKALTQPALRRLTFNDTQFGTGCYGSSSTVFFSIYLSLGDRQVPRYSKPVTVGGHRLYNDSGTSKIYCSLTSAQGRTSAGRYEQLSFDASARNVKKPPAQLCKQAALAAASYLTVAKLK